VARDRPISEVTVDELRQRYLREGCSTTKRVIALLRGDPRAGVLAIADELERRTQADRKERLRLKRLRRFEEPLWKQGLLRIAGVDEAGMSPLAGPVVAAAAVLPVGYARAGIDDSKRLDARQRESLAEHIKREALCWAVGVVEPDEIDRINIYRAGLLAMRRAVEGLALAPDYLLIDARSLKELAIPQRGIVRGDALSISIAAASILAKTTRDARMVELDRQFPGYGLARHKGYPVKEHVEALARHGVTPVHRRSFEPVRRALGGIPEQQSLL
jgi:ribonuclease HII